MKDFGLKKLYYSISEVSKITDLEQYILRYWETEFEQLKPSKNRAGNRIYTNKDIKVIMLIRKLLRDEKYTIEGAKKILADENNYKITSDKKEDAEKAEIVGKEKENYQEGTVEEVSNEVSGKDFKETLEQVRKFLVDLKSYL